MNKRRHVPVIAFQRGIALVEGMIAILILSVGVLGVVGLQASMVKATTDARYRAEASFIAQQRLGQLWVDANNLAAYVEGEPGTDISAASGLPNGRRVTIRGDASCAGDPACIIVRVMWQQPGTEEVRMVTNVAYVTP